MPSRKSVAGLPMVCSTASVRPVSGGCPLLAPSTPARARPVVQVLVVSVHLLHGARSRERGWRTNVTPQREKAHCHLQCICELEVSMNCRSNTEQLSQNFVYLSKHTKRRRMDKGLCSVYCPFHTAPINTSDITIAQI